MVIARFLDLPWPPWKQTVQYEDPEVAVGSVELEHISGRDKFISNFRKDEVRRDGGDYAALDIATRWYIQHIEYNIGKLWTPLIQLIVAGVDRECLIPSSDDNAIIFEFLLEVSVQLETKKDLTMVDLVDYFYNNNIFRDAGDERVMAYNLVFISLGWLTMLFEPEKLSQGGAPANSFHISSNMWSMTGAPEENDGRIFETFKQGLDSVDMELHGLLSQFGPIIPNLSSSDWAGTAAHFPAGGFSPSMICYQTLRKVCRVELKFTDSIAEHLDFNQASRHLKIFRCPSFCRIMFKHQKKELLSQLFQDYTNEVEVGRNTANFRRMNVNATSNYFKEMLLTYRLIFGQDSSSWQLFSREMNRLAKQGHAITKLEDADALLMVLCGMSSDSPVAQQLYRVDLGAPDMAPYLQSTSFPYFAQRILAIQTFVRLENPHDLNTLWHDRRNEGNWWQFWAVLIIGGSTVVMGILQLAFQIWQSVSSEKSAP